jgi:hypothetical protein
MKFEKEYETSFSMTRNLFSPLRAHRLRKKISHSVQPTKSFALCIGTNHTGKKTLPENFFLAIPKTT